MSDLFSRLAERTLCLATVATPAVAPLFAPGPQIAAQQAGADPERPETVANQPMAPAPQPSAEVPDTLPKTPLSRETMSDQPAPTTPQLPELPVPIARTEAPTTKRAIRVDSIERDVRRAETALSNSAPPARQLSSPAETATRVIEPEPKGEHAEPDAARPVRGHRPGTSVVLTREPINPFGHRSAMAEERGQATAVVSVNIGRIEVRAMYPEPSVQAVASPPQSSTLSLTDYLKERDSGMR